jgi:hypothetical protein
VLNNGKDKWLYIQKRGQLDFSRIESPKKVISYITKGFSKPDFQERMFACKVPLNKA